MNISVRLYDRILLLNIDGPTTEKDLQQLAAFVNTLASRISAVLLDVLQAQLDPSAPPVLFRLKKQYEKSRIRFLIVSPELIGADAATLANAALMLGSSESIRVNEILQIDAELAEATREVAKIRGELAGMLGLEPAPAPAAPAAPAAGAPAPGAAAPSPAAAPSAAAPAPAGPTAADLNRAVRAQEDKNKQLLHLFKTLSSEINHLQGNKDEIVMPGADNPDAVRVSELKRYALDTIKSLKVLE